MTSSSEAMKRLKEGNHRFASGKIQSRTEINHVQRAELANEQKPFAVILGCSDSRVPGEMVFDQGLGDLFVIRIAGNIVAPSQIGSIEFAVKKFKTPLVVVLGHSNCGAVLTTIEELQNPSDKKSPHLHAIVDRIRPSVEMITKAHPSRKQDDFLDQAIRSNIDFSVNHLKEESKILEQSIREDGLLIIGAEYSLKSGKVDFFHTL